MESKPLASIHALLVDDFRPFRLFLVSLLQQRPQIDIVGEAEDGIEAVQMAQKLLPDLILMDISIPKLNGIEVAQRIRVLSPKSKILFVTLTDDARLMQKAIHLGAAGYVVKTDAVRELLLAIDAVLRCERFVGARFAGVGSAEAARGNAIESS